MEEGMGFTSRLLLSALRATFVRFRSLRLCKNAIRAFLSNPRELALLAREFSPTPSSRRFPLEFSI